MATKRISKSAVDWSKISTLVSEYEAHSLKKFRAISEGYLRRVQELPEAPPAIDFGKLKATVSNKEIVDKLEASYKQALSKVPYPVDTLADEIDKMEKKDAEDSKDLIAYFQERIDECHQLKQKFEKMIPIEWHTHETFAMTFPDWGYWYKTESLGLLPPPSLSKEEIAELKKPTRLDLEARF